MAFVQEKDGVATGGAIVSLTLAMLVERCLQKLKTVKLDNKHMMAG